MIQNYFGPKDWHRRAKDDLHECTQYDMHNASGYIIAFYLAASHVVGIADNEMLDRFLLD